MNLIILSACNLPTEWQQWVSDNLALAGGEIITGVQRVCVSVEVSNVLKCGITCVIKPRLLPQ